MDKLLERIEDLCKEHSWTRFKLSQKSGIAQSTIATWFDETRGCLPSVPSLRIIAESFDITMSMLFAGCETKKCATIEITEEINEIFQKLDKLSKKQREVVLIVINSYLQKDDDG